jgi:gliding motility-associated protein GldM
MAGFKETPRQKMISMMYLVLTALLALNVSREILHAYLIVNESIESTQEQLGMASNDLYAEFQNQNKINPKKVGPKLEKALQVQKLSKKFREYVEELKVNLLAKTEKIPYDSAKIKTLEQIKSQDNYDIPTHYLIGNETMKNGKAYELVDTIRAYRDKLYALLDSPEDSTIAKIGLNEIDKIYKDKDGHKKEWAFFNFYHTILSADVVILNKLMVESQTAENNMIRYLFNSITKSDFKFDATAAVVSYESNYVMQGDRYKADIMLAAYDSKANPDIYIMMNSDSLRPSDKSKATKLEVVNGRAILDIPGGGAGTHKYAGFIAVKDPTGKIKYNHFRGQYIVAKPAASVSATKMNVFYRGVDNPVTVAASGNYKTISPKISAGSIVPASGGGYIVRNLPGTVKTVKVSVIGDGNNLGGQEFRVKDLPNPEALIPGALDGKIAKSKILANPFIFAKLPKWVEFEFKFKVLSYELMIPQGGGDVLTYKGKGSRLTKDMLNKIKTLARKDFLIFTNIRVKGPLRTRKINQLTVTLK